MSNFYNNKNDSYQNGLAIGVCLGLILGSLFNNLGLGMIIGICLGMLYDQGYLKRR